MPDMVDQHSGPAARILDAAQLLVQQYGFNAVSFAAIAAELDIAKPTVHYHFAAKDDLGAALIERYRLRFTAALDGLASQGLAAPAAVAAYVELFRDVLVTDRMCLCGMLAAEISTLTPQMQDSVRAFFADSEAWLADVFERGSAEGDFTLTGPALQHARLVVSGLEGAMLVARAHNDPSRFDAVAGGLVGTISAGS